MYLLWLRKYSVHNATLKDEKCCLIAPMAEHSLNICCLHCRKASSPRLLFPDFFLFGGCTYFEQCCSIISLLGRMPSSSRAAQAALPIVGLPIKLMLPAVCSFVCPGLGCGIVLPTVSSSRACCLHINSLGKRRGAMKQFRKERRCKGTSGCVSYAQK